MLLMFSSGEENIHMVDPITSGRRYTLTLWFSLDTSQNADQNYTTYISSHLVPHSLMTHQKPVEGWDLFGEKMDTLGISLCDHMKRESSPILVQSLGKKIPHVFHNLQEALDMASFCLWKL